MSETEKVRKETTLPGYINRNRQKNLGRREPPLAGNDYGQFVYILNCAACGFIYGANGSDIHLRKCPNCQGGKQGLALFTEESIEVQKTTISDESFLYPSEDAIL